MTNVGDSRDVPTETLPPGWELATLPPPAAHKRRGRPRITLLPGQSIRRLVTGKANARGYNAQFLATERPDYHADIRWDEGKRYMYIWRDPQKETP